MLVEDAELEDDTREDEVLGALADWEKIGAQLKGRLIAGWPRYVATFRAYRRALMRAGHDDRAADQFGALGAAYNLMLYDAFDPAAAEAWAAMLPAASLAETSGFLTDEEECLMRLRRALAA